MVNSGTPVEFSHCAKRKQVEGSILVLRRSGNFGGGHLLEVVNGGRLSVVLLVKIVQDGRERVVTQLRSQHVKHERAFFRHDRAVLRRIKTQPIRLRDRRGVFIHQSANGEFFEHSVQTRHAVRLLGVHGARIGGETVREPGIGGRSGKDTIAEPLPCRELRKDFVVCLRGPLPRAHE